MKMYDHVTHTVSLNVKKTILLFLFYIFFSEKNVNIIEGQDEQ